MYLMEVIKNFQMNHYFLLSKNLNYFSSINIFKNYFFLIQLFNYIAEAIKNFLINFKVKLKVVFLVKMKRLINFIN